MMLMKESGNPTINSNALSYCYFSQSPIFQIGMLFRFPKGKLKLLKTLKTIWWTIWTARLPLMSWQASMTLARLLWRIVSRKFMESLFSSGEKSISLIMHADSLKRRIIRFLKFPKLSVTLHRPSSLRHSRSMWVALPPSTKISFVFSVYFLSFQFKYIYIPY